MQVYNIQTYISISRHFMYIIAKSWRGQVTRFQMVIYLGIAMKCLFPLHRKKATLHGGLLRNCKTLFIGLFPGFCQVSLYKLGLSFPWLNVIYSLSFALDGSMLP